MTGSLSFEEYLDHIEADSARLGLVIADLLTETVPGCAEWRGRDLTEHVTRVLSFWERQLEIADPASAEEADDRPDADDEEQIPFLDAATSNLLGTLRRLGPDEPCWNWSGEDLVSGWVARRMAIELAVHRYDAELTAAVPTPIATDLAADGIDERIDVHLRIDIVDHPDVCLGGSLCLVCTDVEAAWVVEVGNGRLKCRSGRGPASAVLRGPASDVFLWSWNRILRDAGALQLTGDPAVTERWASLPI
jgi:uncharacterized protein (TIGR03083 family)